MPSPAGRRALARLLSGLVATVALAAAPGVAHAQIVFGANLNRPVNGGFDCGVMPSSAGIFFVTNVGSCTWAATGANFGQQESFLVPSGVGTITSVRVKVGAITGPMQVVVLRSIRGFDPNQPPPGSLVCCFEVGRSAVFTPAPNAVTTVATSLPVKSDIVPNPLTNAYEFDTLGLSVLAPGVPVPLHDTGIYADLSAPSAAVFYPAVGPGEERFGLAGPAGIFGYQVLMDATWVPGQGGGGGGGAAPAAVPSSSRSRRGSGTSCCSASAATRRRPASGPSPSGTWVP